MEKIIDENELERFRQLCDFAIDARSPKEFAEDHIDGAINVPILDDDQHAEIGKLHVSDAFGARKLGAVYALAAVKTFVESPLVQEAAKSCRFMIYCARGGMRSGALATVLGQIGFPIFRLTRGYKTYRSYVGHLLERPLPGPVYVLYGYTGSGKTQLMKSLCDCFNVLDLEACARHRGSLLGGFAGIPQPTQRGFESAIIESIRGFQPGRPVLIEGESRAIGRCQVPGGLWRQMRAGRHLWLDIPRAVRTAFILKDYGDLKNPAFLGARLTKLSRYIARKHMAALHEAMSDGDWTSFVDLLLEVHYDPLYGKRLAQGQCEEIKATGLAEARELLGELAIRPQAAPV